MHRCIYISVGDFYRWHVSMIKPCYKDVVIEDKPLISHRFHCSKHVCRTSWAVPFPTKTQEEVNTIPNEQNPFSTANLKTTRAQGAIIYSPYAKQLRKIRNQWNVFLKRRGSAGKIILAVVKTDPGLQGFRNMGKLKWFLTQNVILNEMKRVTSAFGFNTPDLSTCFLYK